MLLALLLDRYFFPGKPSSLFVKKSVQKGSFYKKDARPSPIFKSRRPRSLPKALKVTRKIVISHLARRMLFIQVSRFQAVSRKSETRKSRDLSGVENQSSWMNRQTFPSG